MDKHAQIIIFLSENSLAKKKKEKKKRFYVKSRYADVCAILIDLNIKRGVSSTRARAFIIFSLLCVIRRT